MTHFHNARVIKSNLNQPIPKRIGGLDLGKNPGALWHGSSRYEPIQADRAQAVPPYLTNPSLIENPKSNVFGFRVPAIARLRIVASAAYIDLLPKPQRELEIRLAKLGHGVTLNIPTQTRNSLVELHSETGITWDVCGVAESEELGGIISIDAWGVPGHSVAPDSRQAGRALIEFLD